MWVCPQCGQKEEQPLASAVGHHCPKARKWVEMQRKEEP